ncbi:MAG: outer membrane beta-barrel protein [Vicinamibacterales bacterium]
MKIRPRLALVCLLCGAAPAFAQEVDPPPAPRKPRAFEIRGYFVAGSEQTESPKTFDAIFGSERLLLIGGGGELIVARRWLVRGQVSQFSDTGTRVFVDAGEVFSLNIPLEVTVRATEFSAGYRFLVKPRWALFAAAGRTQYSLTERSNDETDRSKGSGWHVLAGVDVKPIKWVMLAGEAQWTRTEDILGGGAAEALGESQLGGLRLAGRIGFAF